MSWRRFFTTPFLAALTTLAALPAGAARAADSSGLEARYGAEVKPFLAKHCTGCHNAEKRKGDLVLDAYTDGKAALAAPKVWVKVLERLRLREMPPKGRPRPEEAEVAAVAPWLEEAASGGPAGKRDPGRVTLRRLNRAEYNNTVRDLLGVDFRPGDDFPSDDVGYGFDNIGDVLSMPPILLEKYLAAAEKVAEKAIPSSAPPKARVRRFEAESLECTAEKKELRPTRITLSSSGEVRAWMPFQHDGMYVLRARAFGTPVGPEPPQMAFRIDGRDLGTLKVEAVRDAARIYEARAEVKGGERRVGVAFLNPFSDAAEKDPEKRQRQLVVSWLEVEGPIDARAAEKPEPVKRLWACEPAGDSKRECARKILDALATRAYRRPALETEVSRLARLVEEAERDGGTVEDGLRLALEAILVSPSFLFRVEIDPEPGNPDAAHPVSDFELATRLSYFLWSSLPDDELFQLAREEKLQKDESLEAQALRMLKDPKAGALTENFCGQWLTIRNLATITPDKGRFPAFDEELRAAMRKETELFFGAILKEDRSILDFIDADFTFLNERLARHYGIAGVEGREFRRVALGKDRSRGGVLTQASVLAVTSNPTRTSPVKRGKWVLEQILGTPPPPPPPGAGELKDGDQAELKGTLRERMVQHRRDPLCASCHSRMDPLGFGLENFDAVGAWREKDGNFAVDSSGELPDGRSFKGPEGLKAVLMAQEEQFTRALAEKMLTFALGRGLEYYDRRAVDGIAQAARSKAHRFSSLVLAIVKSDPFRMRRGERSPE